MRENTFWGAGFTYGKEGDGGGKSPVRGGNEKRVKPPVGARRRAGRAEKGGNGRQKPKLSN